MLDILPALLWIVAAVIAVNICSITAIRGNIFSKTKRDVYPVRWSIVGLHFTSLVIGALPYPVYAMFKSGFSANSDKPSKADRKKASSAAKTPSAILLDYIEQSPERGRADIIQRCYVQKRVAAFG